MKLRYKLSLASKIALETAFECGDWACEVEDSLGEEAHSYFAVFSYWQVAKWASVARRVPSLCRVTNVEGISMEHHRAVANLPPQEARERLLTAAREGQTAAELKRILEPSERVREKCWTYKELWEKAKEWPDDNPHGAFVFIQWLEEHGKFSESTAG